MRQSEERADLSTPIQQTNMKKTLATIGIAATLGTAVVGATTEPLKAPSSRIVDAVERVENGETIVQYVYQEAYPYEKNEIQGLRTENSITIDNGDGTQTMKVTLGNPYAKEGDVWYQDKVATTSKANFTARTLGRNLIRKAEAYQVGAGNQDAHEAETNYGFTNSDNGTLIQAAANNYERFWSGYYFGNVTVPQGATITSATFEGYALSGTQNLVATVVGNDVDNANNFATEADVNGRTQTTASVNWTSQPLTSSAYNTSPDISTVVQEIVDRAGWSSGNAMVILVKGRSNGSVQSAFFAGYETSPSQAAILNISYSAGGGGGGTDDTFIQILES